jgi:hypothetical protein
MHEGEFSFKEIDTGTYEDRMFCPTCGRDVRILTENNGRQASISIVEKGDQEAGHHVAIGPFDSQDADLPPAIGNI